MGDVAAEVTVGALAVAARRANAVGAVRITIGGDGLDIELVRVTGFAPGFAPSGVAAPVGFRVPFTAVRGLVRDGRMLYLAFDPEVVTPYNRFALTGFADDSATVLARSWKERAGARWASLLLPAPLGAIVAAAVPGDLVAGLFGRVSAFALASLAFFTVLREVWEWRAWGGPVSDRLRDRFEAALAERLALTPAPPITRPHATPLALRWPVNRRPKATPIFSARARPASSVAPASAAAGPLARPLAAAIAAAVCVVGVMAFLAHYASPHAAPPRVPLLAAGLGVGVRSTRQAERPPPVFDHCVCTRADSPLWKDGVPLLATLAFHGDEEAGVPLAELLPAINREGAGRYKFDLAVVNDGAGPLHDVRFTLTFARRSKAGRRVGATDRGLFWSGTLAGGRAVKWRVDAPGTEMRIDSSVSGTLDSAHVEPAAADAFFKLTSSRFRAVRIHGAAMLAYLRDPRADAVSRAITPQSAADEIEVARIRRAAAPIFACDVHRAPPTAGARRLDACVFNASTKPQPGLAIREIVASPASPRTIPIEATLPVHEGLRVVLQVPADFADEISIIDPSD